MSAGFSSSRMPTTAKTWTSRRMPLADAGTFFGPHNVAHQHVGGIGHQDTTRVGSHFDPRREVHFAADDRVIHAIVGAEIADVAIAGVDADAHLEGLFETVRAP